VNLYRESSGSLRGEGQDERGCSPVWLVGVSPLESKRRWCQLPRTAQSEVLWCVQCA
jgi:hypothetical protein